MTTSFSDSCSSQRHSVIENRYVCGLRVLRRLGLLCCLLVLGASGSPIAATEVATVQPEESRMWMSIGEHRFAITLADTEAAREFAAMLPFTIDMPDLNNNEKHAELPKSLPTNASRPGTIRNGDLMLYGSQTLVVFYLTFNSSYSYTHLGRVDDPADLPQALGRGTARITFSKS